MTETKPRRKMALGRGLDALIPDFGAGADSRLDCEVDRIRPNRFQPRTRFAEEKLRELAESIKSRGVLQPLLVRRDDADFELVAGERRLRAARLAGLTRVPVMVREVSDAEMLEISIVENIQRADLNPLEEADAYQRLIDAFGLTQEEAARRVGKSRPAVANMLRLRQLPEPVKEAIRTGELSMGHARALLGATTAARRLAAWKTVVRRRLSVRETEALVRRLEKETAKPEPAVSGAAVHFTRLAEDLSRHFGTKVEIQRRGRRGRVEIEFYGDEDLERLLGLLRPS